MITTHRKCQFILIVLLFFFINAPAFSQFKKGTRMTGVTIGSIYANSGKSEYSDPGIPSGFTSGNNNYGISVNPSLGWFVSDNTIIGAILTSGYRHQKIFDESNGNTFRREISDFFNIGVGGFVRNYFSATGSMMPFGQFSLNLGIGSSDKEGFSRSGNDRSTFAGKSSGDFFANSGISIGLTKMLNPNTGIDFYAGYNFSFNKNSYKTTTQIDRGNDGSIDETGVSNLTTKYNNHGFTIGVGFQIFLNKRE